MSDELRRFLAAAGRDRFDAHHLVDDPERADLVLFVDSARPDLRDIRDHPLYQRNVEITFVVHHGDTILVFTPARNTAGRGLGEPGREDF